MIIIISKTQFHKYSSIGVLGNITRKQPTLPLSHFPHFFLVFCRALTVVLQSHSKIQAASFSFFINLSVEFSKGGWSFRESLQETDSLFRLDFLIRYLFLSNFFYFLISFVSFFRSFCRKEARILRDESSEIMACSVLKPMI